MRLKRFIFAFCLLAITASGATYYIDYTSGNDANAGTSTAAAWKRHPYMAGWTGSYSHSAGDRFIFKGGETWPNACFPITVAAGGSSESWDYYGYTNNWYSGGSWSQPVLNAQTNAIGTGAGNIMVSFTYRSYITLDNFDFSGYYWDSDHQGYGQSMVAMSEASFISVINCTFHNWTHGTYASGTSDQNSFIVVGTTYGYYPGTMISNCVFNGTASSGDSMMAAYCIWTVKDCIATNMANGFLTGGYPGEVSGCVISINDSFDPTEHENCIEPEGPAGTMYIFNNRILKATAACCILGDAGTNFIVYNNVITNLGGVSIGAIQLDSSINTTKAFNAAIFNNTIVSASACVTGSRGDITASVTNNHFIGPASYAGIDTLLEGNNYTNANEAAASAVGYTFASNFAPTSGSGPTVNAGIDLSSYFTTDITGETRGSTWDIGAYEYDAGAPPAPTVINVDTLIFRGQ